MSAPPVAIRNLFLLLLLCALSAPQQADGDHALGETHHVRSHGDVTRLIESQSVKPGDIIVWEDGEYDGQTIGLNGLNGDAENPITLRAATPGGVVLLGRSQIRINAHWWVVEGFHFKGNARPNAYNPVQFRGSGDIGAEHVRLTNCAFTDLNNREESAKWVQVYGRFNRIDHCHFSGKSNKGALLTVELGALGKEVSAEHLIEWNYFSDIAPSEGSDNETIRVGFSGDQNKPARCVIQHNLFVRCDGENEIVSNKSSYNTYAANTFRQCNGSLVLRHGHHATVRGNYFLGEGASDAGGLRINDSHHRVFNNYMQDLTGRTWNAALSIEGGKKKSGSSSNGYQSVDDLVVAHNTIVDCANSFFLNDKHGKRAPNGVIANNLVVTRSAEPGLINARLPVTGLNWQTNLFFGPGETSGLAGLTGQIVADPKLVEANGRYRPGPSSPAVDAASDAPGFVDLDIEQRTRPTLGKDIGADELGAATTGEERSLPLDTGRVGAAFLRASERPAKQK